MLRPRSILAAFGFATAFLLSACVRKSTSPAPTPPAAQAAPTGRDHSAALALPSLAAKFRGSFSIGAAIEPWHLRDMPDLLTHHYNRLTAENQMKLGVLCPSPPSAPQGASPGASLGCSFERADEIADFARRRGFAMSGHTFVWHQMQPAWFFREGPNAASAEVVTARLRKHVFALTQRYADVIDNWDVVNEAISESPGITYRDGAEGSPWFTAFGGREYIKVAFQLAAEAAAAHDPDVVLYYNDYNVVVPEKRAKILEMIRWLRSEGVRVDGVGMQGHWNIEWPPASDIVIAIDELAAEGLRVKVSELDISIYSEDEPVTRTWQPELELTPALEARLAVRYAEVFRALLQRAEVLDQVTFWGVSDDRTWLNSWPVARKNAPLLFDRNHQPKAALRALLEL